MLCQGEGAQGRLQAACTRRHAPAWAGAAAAAAAGASPPPAQRQHTSRPPTRAAPAQVGAAKEAARTAAGQQGGGRWATVGVVAAKATAVTKRGDNYSRWTISDLDGAEVGAGGWGAGERGRPGGARGRRAGCRACQLTRWPACQATPATHPHAPACSWR